MANSKRLCKYHDTRTREYIVVNKMAFCTFDSAVKWASENKLIGKRKIENDQKKAQIQRKKVFKENDKPLRKREAQKAFNTFIRFRDGGLNCISCLRFHSGQYHAGHYKSTGASPELRFEELNCHKQCAPCNNHLSGNIEKYRINLVKKIGIDKVEWLEGPHEPKKYTCSDLKEIEKHFKSKLKVLKLNSNQL